MERVTLTDRQGIWQLTAAHQIVDAVIQAAGADPPDRDEPVFPVVEDELERFDRILNGTEKPEEAAPENNPVNRSKLLGMFGGA